MKIVKYKNPLLYIIDLFCTIAMYPWLALLSLFLSCYWSTTYERERPGQKIIQWAIFGPILGLFVAFLFPFTVLGYVIWVITCKCKYYYMTL